MNEILEANAVYTGGNIWLFYGKLVNGDYFLTDDDGWTRILNADPSDLEESTFEEWQQEHLVEDLSGSKRTLFCDKLLDWLLTHPDYRGGMTEVEIVSYRSYFKKN